MIPSDSSSLSIESVHSLLPPPKNEEFDSGAVGGLTMVGGNSRFDARDLEDEFIDGESVSSSSHCSDRHEFNERASANSGGLHQVCFSRAKKAAATLKDAKMFLYAWKDDHEGQHYDYVILKRLNRSKQGKGVGSGGNFAKEEGQNANGSGSAMKASTVFSAGRWSSEKYSHVYRAVSKFVYFRGSRRGC